MGDSLYDGTSLSGFVRAETNRPPRQCSNCVWYKDDLCSHPVVMIDTDVEGESGQPKPVNDEDCCDGFRSKESVILFCLRHGTTEANEKGLFRGLLDVDLDEQGRKQAKAAGEFLKGKGISVIVCSPLKRAVETAQIVAEQIGVDPDGIIEFAGFLPWDVGELSGKPKEENHHVIEYALDNPDWPIPGGTSVKQFGEQHRASLEWLIGEAEKEAAPVLVVFHTSNVIQTEHWAANKVEEARPEDVDSVQPGGIVALYKTSGGFQTKAMLGEVGTDSHYGS